MNGSAHCGVVYVALSHHVLGVVKENEESAMSPKILRPQVSETSRKGLKESIVALNGLSISRVEKVTMLEERNTM